MTEHIVPRSLNCLRNLIGMDELKQLIEEWQIVAQNLQTLPKSPRILLPNCLFAAHSGTGITRLLGLIAQFIEETNLVEFVGDIKYFEFVLDRAENSEIFPAFNRLIENIRAAAGFRGLFKGIVSVDISEWVYELDDIRFHRFLEYASDFSDNILFIFIIPLIEDKTIEKVEAAIASYLRLRKLKLDFPDSDALYIYVTKRLEEYGFKLETGIEEILAQTLNEARDMQCFDGYNTLNHLVEDMIYEKCSHKLIDNYLITLKDLHLFLPDGPWIKQLARNNRLSIKVGFGNS